MEESELTLVVPGRVLPAGAGWDWIVAGWRLFMRAPVMWLIATVIYLVLMVVSGFVPIIGSLVFQLLQPALLAGFVIACRSLETGGDFDLEHLFGGFKRHFGGLLLLGVLILAGWILCFLVFAGFVGFSILGAVLTGNADNVMAAIATSSLMLLLGLLVVLLLAIPLLAAYWFAPALVVMHDMAPLAALKASLSACMRNFLSFAVVYGIVMSVLFIIALIPVFLGLLVWIPLVFASSYVAYRQIFTAEPIAIEPAA
jgi:uncharacterized membrane protein